MVLAEGQPKIEVSDLPPEVRGQPSSAATSASEILSLAEVERRHILATLHRLEGDRKAAADALGIGAHTLWRKLKQYGLVKPRRS